MSNPYLSDEGLALVTFLFSLLSIANLCGLGPFKFLLFFVLVTRTASQYRR